MDIMSYTGNLFAFLRWRHPRYLLSISYLQIKFSEQFSANANLLNPKAGLFLECDVWEDVTLTQIFIKKDIVSSKFDYQGSEEMVSFNFDSISQYFISKICLYTSSTPGQKPKFLAVKSRTATIFGKHGCCPWLGMVPVAARLSAAQWCNFCKLVYIETGSPSHLPVGTPTSVHPD